MDRILEKLGEVSATLTGHGEMIREMRFDQKAMNDTLNENTHQLAIHIEGVQQTREQIKLVRQELDDRVAPIEEQAKVFSFTYRALIALFAAPACLYYALKIAKEFLHLFGG